MTGEPLFQELISKTIKRIGKDVSLFRCDGKEILSVEKVEITKMTTPSSSKKQLLSFEGKVWLQLKEGNGCIERDFNFRGSIEVVNYNSFLGLKETPFVIHINR